MAVFYGAAKRAYIVQTIYKKLNKILQIEILNLHILDWGSPLSNDLILELHNMI